MNALVFERGKPLQLAQLAPPVIEAPDDVLIRIRATGVYGTDIHILGGAYPTKPSLTKLILKHLHDWRSLSGWARRCRARLVPPSVGASLRPGVPAACTYQSNIARRTLSA
jgi:hypothetical protein